MPERFSRVPRYSNEFANQSDTGRDVPPDIDAPSDIDARTWLGSQERIRQRRLRALLESIEAAIELGDRAAALAAVDEARHLRPDARELPSVSARALALPAEAAAAVSRGSFWPRMFSAVALLLVGHSLLIGLDWLQMSSLPPLPLPPSAASMPALGPLNIPVVIEVAATSRSRPATPRRVRSRPAEAGPHITTAVAGPVTAASVPASTRPVGWQRVLKPTARFLTKTLPRFLGMRNPESAEAGRRRSST